VTLPPLVEICIVVATLAVVAIAVAAVRAMRRVEKMTDQFANLSREIHLWVGQADELTREAREAVAAAGAVIAPIRRVADRFEILGERVAGLSGAVLGEIEGPIHSAVAVIRGVRSVTGYFLDRWSHRSGGGRAATNGEPDHPAAQDRTETSVIHGRPQENS